MYNKYTYDLSKDTGMNMNLNMADCFEEVEPDNINEILNKIHSDVIAQQEKEKEKEKEPPIKSRLNRYKERTRYSIK